MRAARASLRASAEGRDFPGWREMLWQRRAKAMASFTLHDLEQRIKARAQQASADASYTRKLLDGGVAHCAKKFGEEAIETVLAAIDEDRERLIAEAGDLIYHLLVVLAARGIALAEVEAALAARTRQSGLAEKASRQPGKAKRGRGRRGTHEQG
jgi:phosphoribosyl-ATP pyrophosphohydrolase